MNLFNESSESEVEPFSEELIPNASRLEARITETTLDGLLSTPLRLHEDLTRGCGGQIWPAGSCLSKYLLRKFQGKGLEDSKLVELGAGGGLVGLAIASAFGSRNLKISITDQEPMMDLMRRNVQLNGLDVDVQLLNWGEQIPSVIAESPVDIVLAADCVYFEPAFPLLEKTLIDLVGPKTTVYFCFKKRRRADLKFMKSITKRLNVVEITDFPEYRDCFRESIFLYTMTKMSPK